MKLTAEDNQHKTFAFDLGIFNQGIASDPRSVKILQNWKPYKTPNPPIQ